jgi:hypothetical protein
MGDTLDANTGLRGQPSRSSVTACSLVGERKNRVVFMVLLLSDAMEKETASAFVFGCFEAPSPCLILEILASKSESEREKVCVCECVLL